MACYNKARGIVEDNLDILHKIAQTLLEKEVIDGAEIDKIVQEGAATS
jgi:cell division protease FtsH